MLLGAFIGKATPLPHQPSRGISQTQCDLSGKLHSKVNSIFSSDGAPPSTAVITVASSLFSLLFHLGASLFILHTVA